MKNALSTYAEEKNIQKVIFGLAMSKSQLYKDLRVKPKIIILKVLKTKMSCIFIINYAEALKLSQDHIVYISFYTANAQLTANLIRLTEICLNCTFIYHTRETNATRSAETLSSEHLNGRITFLCCNPSHKE